MFTCIHIHTHIRYLCITGTSIAWFYVYSLNRSIIFDNVHLKMVSCVHTQTHTHERESLLSYILYNLFCFYIQWNPEFTGQKWKEKQKIPKTNQFFKKFTLISNMPPCIKKNLTDNFPKSAVTKLKLFNRHQAMDNKHFAKKTHSIDLHFIFFLNKVAFTWRTYFIWKSLEQHSIQICIRYNMRNLTLR